MTVEPSVGEAVQARLGVAYEELLEVMLDLGSPPIFAFGDDRRRMVQARERAVAAIEAWEAQEPDAIRELIANVPEGLRVPSSAQSLLEAATWNDYFDIPPSILAMPDRNARVFSALPDLFGEIDDDGLIDLRLHDSNGHGVFVDDYSLHYHQLLRRGFGSNVHYNLIGALIAMARGNDVAAHVAIDERRLRFRDEHEELEERDYWYGPPLSETLLDDPNSIGETVHGDPNQGRSILNPYAALSVRWTRHGAEKTVEIEELVPVVDRGDEDGIVLARYLHAIRDTANERFVHCDGAVKAYNAAAYPRRIEGFRARGKGVHYRKVFRVDGHISTDDWGNLAALWFRGNTLILEYLSSIDRGSWSSS